MALQDDAHSLADLDRKVVEAFDSGDTVSFIRKLCAFVDLRASLKRRLLDECVICVEDEVARTVLLGVYSVGDFQSDKIVHRLSKLGSDDIVGDEFSDAEIEKLGSEKFYSWYSHTEYVKALGELRPLIVQCATSESVKRIVEEVKMCYAFQQYAGALGLCRTLLEASIRDICARRGLFSERDKSEVLYEQISWKKLRDRVSCGQLNDRLKALYERQCRVLHARSDAGQKDARVVFHGTLLVIEELYELHIV